MQGCLGSLWLCEGIRGSDANLLIRGTLGKSEPQLQPSSSGGIDEGGGVANRCIQTFVSRNFKHCSWGEKSHVSVHFGGSPLGGAGVSVSEMGKRTGGDYVCDNEDRRKFQEDGYVHLSGVLSPEEIAEIEQEYMKFIDRQIPVEGRDFCDMSGDYSKPLSDFSIVNIMLPRKYHPAMKDNVYERKAASIAAQLCGPDMVLDYDQLLAKPPGKADGVFGWHQDLAYWPITPDTTTASFWLAIDDSRTENGCIRFVPGTHLERELRKHAPPFGDRDKSHLLTAELQEGDRVVPAEIKRGDVTVHHERILHGSGPNTSRSSWRRAYVLAFRRRSTVEEERRRGFTHSHNDKMEVLTSVGEGYSS